MKTKHISSSRRATPWSTANSEANKIELTGIQKLIDETNQANYYYKHPLQIDSNDAYILNNFILKHCKFCNSTYLQKDGFTKNGIQRYRCRECSKRYTLTKNSIFENHKIPISEWIEYLLSLFREQSFTSISKMNKNSYTTTNYWLKKVFLLIDDYQNNIILSNNIQIDETFYSVVKREIPIIKGKKQRGLSNSKICIGIACDDTHVYCSVEGTGKTSMRKTTDTFIDHIKPGATLIHDAEKSHNELVQLLNLTSIQYHSKDLKGFSDEDNPLNPINTRCSQLKRFLNSHSGINRNELQNLLNLYSFIFNPPINPYEKIEILLNWAFEKPISLKYRELY